MLTSEIVIDVSLDQVKDSQSPPPRPHASKGISNLVKHHFHIIDNVAIMCM